MGDEKLEKLLVHTFVKNVEVIKNAFEGMCDFLNATLPADIEYPEMTQKVSKFTWFEINSINLFQRWLEMCEIRDQLESLQYNHILGLDVLCYEVYDELIRLARVRDKKGMELRLLEKILLQVNYFHKDIAELIGNFNEFMVCNREVYSIEDMFRPRDELQKLFQAHREFLVDKKRAKNDLKAIKVNEEAIAILLQSKQLCLERTNPYVVYDNKALEMDWQLLEKLETERADALRKQVELHKLGDNLCREFADNINKCVEALRNDAQTLTDKELQILQDAQARLDFMGITLNPYTSHTLDGFLATMHRNAQTKGEKIPLCNASLQPEKVSTKPVAKTRRTRK